MARVALGVAVAAFAACCGVGQAADIAEIRSRLREIETSISSLSIRYVVTNDANPGFNLECEYLQKGPAMRIIAESPGVYTWNTFDGQFEYGVQVDPDDHSAIDAIYKSHLKYAGRLSQMPTTPLQWWGLIINGPNRPLHELLENATILDESRVRGEPVVSIVTEKIERPGVESVRYFCQFVTSRDYAPLTIRAEGRPENLVYVVDEFREVEHPQLGRKISVPWKMTFDEMRMEVRELTINPILDSSLFVPKPTSGTELYDMTVPGKTRKTVHGAAKARKKPKTAAAPPSPPPASTAVAVALPDRGVNLSVVGLAAAAVMSLLAILLRRLRRGD